MSWSQRAQWAFLCLGLAATLGCGRQPNTASTRDQGTTEAVNRQLPLPFEHNSQLPGISPSDYLIPLRRIVPVGTMVTIRLQFGLSSAVAHTGDLFAAILDQPLIIQGQTLALPGAPVVGRVVAAQSSGPLHASGYLRLTLASITINGKLVPVGSSTIFVKAASRGKRNWETIGGSPASEAAMENVAESKKGAWTGGTLGLSPSTGLGYGSGGKDVGFAADRQLIFRLTELADQGE